MRYLIQGGCTKSFKKLNNQAYMEQSIGKPIDRFDSHDKVTGKALFPGDINFPDQVVMRTLFSPSPHAIIRKIEFEDAMRLPGVIAVLTAEDGLT